MVEQIVQRVPPSAEEKIQALFDSLPQAELRAALVGTGVRQSRTPWMHEAEGARLKLDYSYSLIDFEALGLPESAIGHFLKCAKREGMAGLNVTHPFKQSIVPFLDALSDEAADIGAVNTVVFTDGRAIGHNTDCWGFAESFRSAMQGAALDRVLLLGAGGAGKAVTRALLDLGAGEIHVYDIAPERASGLTAALKSGRGSAQGVEPGDLPEIARTASGIVNTTPVGMTGYPGMPIPSDAIRPDTWVADIVYFPAETEFLRTAVAAGCRVLPGRGMAIFQAVKAFELITGVQPDRNEMSRHFDSAAPIDLNEPFRPLSPITRSTGGTR